MSLPRAALFGFNFFTPVLIRIEVSGALFTSAAGLLPLRQFDKRSGLLAVTSEDWECRTRLL